MVMSEELRKGGKKEQVFESLSSPTLSRVVGIPWAFQAAQSFPEFSLDRDLKVGPGSSRKAKIR